MKYLFVFTFVLAFIYTINCADSLGAEHPQKDHDKIISEILRVKRSKSGGGAEIGRNVGENIGRMTEDISDSLSPALQKMLKAASDGTKGIGDSFKSLKPSSRKGGNDPMKSEKSKISSQN
uniref:Uncharacterized protein n=1 Tax=Panagrolaimus davidi TaxID=227884 RepID=A0A914QLI3_9BILA